MFLISNVQSSKIAFFLPELRGKIYTKFLPRLCEQEPLIVYNLLGKNG